MGAGQDSGGTGREAGTVEQPNLLAPVDVPALSVRLWVLVVATGVLAGLVGAALMVLLHTAAHLTYAYRSGSFLAAVERAGAARRMVALAAAGALAGTGWWLLRRWTGPGGSEVSTALWRDGGHLPLRRSLGTAVLSVVLVGMGAALAREAAPRLAGAALASRLSGCPAVRLTPHRHRAPPAAGGLRGRCRHGLRVQRPAGRCAADPGGDAGGPVAAAGAACPGRLAHRHRGLLDRAPGGAHLPVARGAAVRFADLVRGADRAAGRAGRGGLGADGQDRARMPSDGVAAAGRAAAGVHRGRRAGRPDPQLLGNGKDIVQLALGALLAVSALAALLFLKPIATAGSLGSGASGGLFTPTVATGALLGALAGQGWMLAWPAPAAGCAVIGAAAVLAAATQAPVAAVVLMLELTRTVDALMVPLLFAVTGAVLVPRRLDTPSIHSVRLPAQ